MEHVAGAFRFAQYDFFRSWAMRWIAAQKGEDVDPQADKEYTDWTALGETLHDWLAGWVTRAPDRISTLKRIRRS